MATAWYDTLLRAAGLPTTGQNEAFMSDWAQHAETGCRWNDVDISHAAAGSTKCSPLPNGDNSRNYVSLTSAADAFASQLNLTDYPSLRRALATGHPYSVTDPAQVALDLEKWGSPKFQAYYAQRTGAGSVDSGGGSTGGGKKPHPMGAWTRWMHALSHQLPADIREINKATAQLNRIARHH